MNQTNDAYLGTEPGRPKVRGRNLPLTIGLGCFGLLVMGSLFIAGILVISNVAMRSSDPYQLALAAAQRDPSLTAALGIPVRAGWLTTGQITITGSSGEADLSIPISGPRGSGTIAVRASKSAGKWSFSSLNVHVSGRSTPLDLIAATPP